MNPLAFLNPYRWLISLGVLVALVGGAWAWHAVKVREAVSAQRQADATVLSATIARINAATAQQQAQAAVETAQRASSAQERIHELQAAQADVAARAASLARQLRQLRATASAHRADVPQAAAAGQGARSDGVSVLPGPVDDSIDSALMARLTQAENLRLSCVKLWEQAQADRKTPTP